MIFSALFTSLMYSVVKFLDHFSVYQIIFFRSLGTLIFTIPLTYKLNIPLMGKKKKLLVSRGLLGLFSMVFFFESIKYLDLGIAVSIRYSSPIFAVFFAFFILKESIKFSQWFFLFLGFTGIVVIKGFGLDIDSTGFLYALLSAIFLALVFVITNKIGNSENTFVIINYFMFMALIFCGFMSASVWITPSSSELILLLLSGILGFFALLFLTKSFQNEQVNVVAPLKYLEVIFSIIIGIFWFQEIYTIWIFIGVILILIGISFKFFQNKLFNSKKYFCL